MPYVALPESGRESRLAEAAIRWDAIATRQPELEPVVALQRELIGVVVDLAETIERGRLPRLSLPPRYLAVKLARGVPAMAREPIPVPVAALQPALPRLCHELAKGGAGEAADQIQSALTEGRLDAAFLLTASLSRDQHAIRAAAMHERLSPDYLWLVAELAVSPYAHALQRAVLTPGSDPALAAALDGWPYGYCPGCGSWPALAEVVALRRLLRCSFCALAWERPMSACVYCGEAGERFTTVAAEEHRTDRHLELCGACAAYLKTLDVAALSPFPLVAVSDLDTLGLDTVAMQRGFHRPTLKEFASPR